MTKQEITFTQSYFFKHKINDVSVMFDTFHLT